MKLKEEAIEKLEKLGFTKGRLYYNYNNISIDIETRKIFINAHNNGRTYGGKYLISDIIAKLVRLDLVELD